MNFITKSGGKRVHEETSAGSFDVDLVRQPIAAKKKITLKYLIQLGVN